MKLFTKAAAAGFVLLLIAAAVLTAGCINPGNTPADTPQTTPSSEPTAEPTQGETPDTPDVMPIVGDWKATFTSDSGSETTMTYHFNSDNTGSISTGKTTTGIHWAYIPDKKAYMINYDALQQQEDMIIIQQDDKQYLYSLGGGYHCERV